MESQMYGTPVLGSDIGGIPELIRVGQTGALFESGNVVELKNMIQHYWKKTRESQDYVFPETEFNSIEKYCDVLMRLYQ
jgi:glycosyltransferase involved in cell wall biosynthesis